MSEPLERQDDSLDVLLREALTARTVESPALDLAAAAMERAHAYEARAAKLMQLGRWMRMTSVAAGILLLLTVAIAWRARAVDTSSGSTVTTVQESDSSTQDSSSNATGMGLAVLGIAVVGVMLRVVVGSGQTDFRMVAREMA